MAGGKLLLQAQWGSALVEGLGQAVLAAAHMGRADSAGNGSYFKETCGQGQNIRMLGMKAWQELATFSVKFSLLLHH